jgi:hypothetical protein
MRPIISIWTKTKKTFQFLEERDDENNSSMINVLFFLSAMTVGFPNSFDIHRIIGGNYYLSLVVSLIVSGLVGVTIYSYVFSYIILGVSRLFKGKASIERIRLVFACSLIPNLIILLVGLVMIIPALILDDKSLIGYSHPIANYILWIVTIKIMVVGLAHFNKYSYLFAVLTVLIPIAFVQGLIFGLKYLIT